MKSRLERILIASLSLVLLASTAYSAPWDQSQRLTRMTNVYDANHIEAVQGIVESIYEKIPSSSSSPNSLGFHMILKTDTETIDIHLGPIWYLKTLEGKIDKGDMVKVVGSWAERHVHKDGKVAMKELRAAEVTKGSVVVLKLRDSTGKPLWSGY